MDELNAEISENIKLKEQIIRQMIGSFTIQYLMICFLSMNIMTMC
jgi:hypothetical protein